MSKLVLEQGEPAGSVFELTEGENVIGRSSSAKFRVTAADVSGQHVRIVLRRGQVTAIYIFMFIVFGALGSQLIGTITQRVFGSDADLRKSIVLTASILMPLAAFAISRGIKPYGREVERLEA